MVGLLSDQLRTEGAVGAVGDGWDVISSRSANVDLLIDVMRRTPAQVPYWDGATYRSLIGAVVPRFLWPDKPQKTLGQEFGHRYHYLVDTDHATSINLPVVVEFYINYGTAGVLAGMFLLGLLIRAIEDLLNSPGQSLFISAAATPLLARMLVMECDLSLVFGGLPMQVTALWVLGLAALWLAGVTVRSDAVRPPWYATFWPPRMAP